MAYPEIPRLWAHRFGCGMPMAAPAHRAASPLEAGIGPRMRPRRYSVARHPRQRSGSAGLEAENRPYRLRRTYGRSMSLRLYENSFAAQILELRRLVLVYG